MKKIKVFIYLITIAALLIPTVFASAGGAFDEWGYNYNAHLFNGLYCDAYQDAAWCQPYKEDHLSMKWNEAWLSRDKVRHEGYPTYVGSGAWLTNHQYGTYIGDDGLTHDWDYFVKIVAMPEAGYDCSLSGGYDIWGEFCVVQEVYNDPYAGFEGVMFHPVDPGLGNLN